ncbi:MAG TPA: MFS transporter [Solirubrobacteraceae bacterium]|nr:MFS transporter [Solirubrobacteraceae bacterium]
MTTRRRFPLLAGRDGRALLAISIVARLPLAMLTIAILVHAQQVTGSFAVAGLACSAFAVGGALASPLAGRLVDRHGQTFVLVGGALLTAAALIALGLAPGDSPRALLVALAGAAGLATPPLEACVRTLLPAIVSRPSQLPALFALESSLLEVTFVAGPPLALGLGAVWSTGAALVASGLILLVGTVAFATRRVSRGWRPDPAVARVRGGSLRAAAIRVLVVIDLGTGIVFGATEVGVTASAKHVAGAAAAAPVLALWGAGSLLGGLIVTRWGDRLRRVLQLPVLLVALAVLHGALVVSTHSLALMGAIILLAGATIAPMTSVLYVMVDRFAPAGTETEAFSWLFTSSCTGAAVGAAVAGALVQAVGPGAAFAFAGVAGGLAAAVAMLGSHHLAPRRPVAICEAAALS